MWINESKTLWEHRNRDTWQLPMMSRDGEYCGNVVAQIVDPKECLVRYFVVFSANQQKQFLIPSDIIACIGEEVYCEVPANHIKELPEFTRQISRQNEAEVYEALACCPYWEH